MKRAGLISIMLIIAFAISTSVFAMSNKASEQLSSYSVNANIDEGSIR